jgi:prepilin-type N-terminal cleavage/methylation domain-containing protein
MKVRGFTLIELLVVIAIIAILAGLLMPVFSKTRKAARQAQEIRNMQQLGVAAINYASQNSGRVPLDKVSSGADSWAQAESSAASTVWYNALPRMMGKLGAGDYGTNNPAAFYTPDNLAYCAAATYPANAASASQPYFAIAMNSKLNQAPLQTIVEASETVLFLEGGLPGETLTQSSQSAYNGQSAVYASRFIARYSNGTGLLLFCDGHAQMLPWQNVVGQSGSYNGTKMAGHAMMPQPGGTGFNPGTSLDRVVWTPNPNDPGGLLP